MLHIYLTIREYFLYQQCFICTATDGISRGEGTVTQETTYGCTLYHPMLYFGTEFKRRLKWTEKLFCTLWVDTGPVIYNTNEYTTYITRNDRRKVYAINIHTIIFFLIYLQMKKKYER